MKNLMKSAIKAAFIVAILAGSVAPEKSHAQAAVTYTVTVSNKHSHKIVKVQTFSTKAAADAYAKKNTNCELVAVVTGMGD